MTNSSNQNYLAGAYYHLHQATYDTQDRARFVHRSSEHWMMTGVLTLLVSIGVSVWSVPAIAYQSCMIEQYDSDTMVDISGDAAHITCQDIVNDSAPVFLLFLAVTALVWVTLAQAIGMFDGGGAVTRAHLEQTEAVRYSLERACQDIKCLGELSASEHAQAIEILEDLWLYPVPDNEYKLRVLGYLATAREHLEHLTQSSNLPPQA